MERIVKIFNSIDELSQFFAERMAQRIYKSPDGQYFSLMLSGGSTPKAIFKYLVANYKDKINWKKLLIFWGDERCVPPDNNESNFKMANEILLSHIPIPKQNIFRIHGEANPSSEAKRYSKIVKEHVLSKNNIPQFDLIMLGLGEDGHMASIFPGNLQLFESDNLFEAVQHPQTKQKRITASGKLINNAQIVIFFVTGETKAAMVSNLLDKKEGWSDLPASQIHPKNGKLLWLLDHYAANLINHKL
jgi:6-phosphogluconolactonase